MSQLWPTGPAQADTCRRCRSALIVGQGEGVGLRCDALPVTVLGELLALMAGRQTYRLHKGSLWEQDQWRIKRNRNGDPVLIGHKCGTRIADQFVEQLAMPESRIGTQFPDIPPY